MRGDGFEFVVSLHEVSKGPAAGDLRQAADMRGWAAGETWFVSLGSQEQ